MTAMAKPKPDAAPAATDTPNQGGDSAEVAPVADVESPPASQVIAIVGCVAEPEGEDGA